MAPRTPKRRTVQHFTHVHPLTEFNGNEFVCDGCKTYGSGKTYRCHGCNYDLHEYCATCPLTIQTFMHPEHELTLVVRKPGSTRQNERMCDICCESVEGLFYRCKICEFDVHPVCTQLPRHVRHVLHPLHPLEFSLSGASTCVVCRSVCTSWRYRCGPCGFDVHMDCVLAVCNAPAVPETKQRGVGFQPPQAVYGVPVGYGPMGPYPYYYGHGYGNGPMNPGQGSGQESGTGKGKRMFNLAQKLAIGVISNSVFGVFAEIFTNMF